MRRVLLTGLTLLGVLALAGCTMFGDSRLSATTDAVRASFEASVGAEEAAALDAEAAFEDFAREIIQRCDEDPNPSVDAFARLQELTSAATVGEAFIAGSAVACPRKS